MTLKAGKKVGPYTIEALVGRGEAGEVYLARDGRRRRFAALKVLSPDIAAQPRQFAQLQREARTGALLNHPNIATVFDVGCDEGVPYVVSELLRGRTLRARMGRGPLAPRVAVRLGRQIASGLAAAHDAGVAHRDLKPENVFIAAWDRVKIVDFGSAKCWFEALELLQAEDASSGGLVGYMSPEQVRGGEGDHRSDIFSLGAMLYEMLSGTAPFRRRTTIETLNAVLNDEPLPLDVSGKIGRDLARIVRRCLAKDPAERYQSARDVEKDLEAACPSSRETAGTLLGAHVLRPLSLLTTVMRLF
ncbi:MAG: serine/threonine-protein kinase [Nitrososphaerales archaeon]